MSLLSITILSPFLAALVVFALRHVFQGAW